MTPEKILAIVAAHKRMLSSSGIPAVEYHHAATIQDSSAALKHCHYMLKKIPTIHRTDAAKAARWLGFVQGVLWAHGMCTIEEMKKLNK